MTTNTDLHVAMPELPHPSWSTMVVDGHQGHYFTADQMREYARAAIQQAAVPEGLSDEIVLSLWREVRNAQLKIIDWDEREPLPVLFYKALLTASPTPPKQQPALGRGDGGGATLPTPPAQRWQFGTWTLTAPDGRTWKADSPLKACSAEQRDRIPPEVALKRIFDALDDGEKS